MEKFYKRIKCTNESSTSSSPNEGPSNFSLPNQTTPISNLTPESSSALIATPQKFSPQEEVSNVNDVIADPGLRPPLHVITKNPKERENIRRAYLVKGPSQPILKPYPTTMMSNKPRKFSASWYNEKEYSQWLEYSKEKDAVFCLYCYLFAFELGDAGSGHDAFVDIGFKNWKKKDRLDVHIGDHLSVHNKCMKACQDLMSRKKHIDIALSNLGVQVKTDYRVRLNATVYCIRFLLRQGLAFRGHDEGEDSLNRGNFLELLKFHSMPNEEIRRVVLANADKNAKMTSPQIQKEICNVMAFLTTKAIIEDIGDSFYSLLVDEARDVSIKEQMGVVLRYVNKKGCVVERFLSIVHVSDTSAKSLKVSIESLFATHGLSLSCLRGQGYDGASNMRGQFNGLKSLILAENKCAFYVHCFAHQLQLALIKVAKKHKRLLTFFDDLHFLSNVVGSSCKRLDILRLKQFEKVQEMINLGEIETGRGLNQEQSLKKPGDTRWNSHYSTILSVISLFSSTIQLLEIIDADPTFDSNCTYATDLLMKIENFEFAFLLHMMKTILAITFELSQALQRKEQDLVNAMSLVNVAKLRLQFMREEYSFEELLAETSEFCSKHKIGIPKMEDVYVPPGRSRRRIEERTNLHFFKVELLYTVIDSQLQELNDRFDNDNTRLISCMACLDPRNSFAAFDKKKLIEFAAFYPMEFNDYDLLMLDGQLSNWLFDMRSHESFSNLSGLGELSQKMVETGKDKNFSLVYLLLKLALTLPVATASVERVFSAMGVLKGELRNRMGDEWLNDCMVTYIEKEVFDTIDDEAILQQFQQMKPRRCVL